MDRRRRRRFCFALHICIGLSVCLTLFVDQARTYVCDRIHGTLPLRSGGTCLRTCADASIIPLPLRRISLSAPLSLRKKNLHQTLLPAAGPEYRTRATTARHGRALEPVMVSHGLVGVRELAICIDSVALAPGRPDRHPHPDAGVRTPARCTLFHAPRRARAA
jgi:hypothetical protein